MYHADTVHIRHFHQVDMKLAMKPSSWEGSMKLAIKPAIKPLSKTAISYSDYETGAMKPVP